jgi:Zn-dependent protease with chaperone function
MDFFERQDQARKTTARLVVLFLLAVLTIIVGIYLVATIAFGGTGLAEAVEGEGLRAGLWDPFLFFTVASITSIVVAGGSLFKTMQLSAGGRVVAELLGGRPLDPASSDKSERRLLNVVEEMALASGIPVPTVYLLENEPGINAFAAGLTTSDAVIGVTRGTLDNLTRDELQGVIGHEFAHVLNGDMRLNVRLMGLIHGILILSVIGYILLRGGGRGGRRGEGGAIVLIGLALYILGYAGVFFGRMIQASVSRQREYLADASSVQFTRNPDSIAGALKKIGGLASGSRVNSPHAPEAGHFFFSRALKGSLFGLFATHPPLTERIRRIDPSFDGTFPPVVPPEKIAAAEAEAKSEDARERLQRVLRPAILGTAAGGAMAAGAGGALGAGGGVLEGHALIEQIGTLSAAHVAYAEALLASIDPALREATHELLGAEAITYALLLGREATVRNNQMSILRQSVEPSVLHELERLLPRVDRLADEARLPLIDMTIPALRKLSAGQYRTFSESIRKLVEADRRITLFEYTLQRIVRHHLEPVFSKVSPPSVQYYSFKGLRQECSVILSAFAWLGHPSEADAGAAFRAGATQLGDDGPFTLVPPTECTVAHVDAALEKLARISMPLRRRFLLAGAAAVAWDHEVTISEGELLRAVADALDCPMPPLLPGQKLIPPGE